MPTVTKQTAAERLLSKKWDDEQEYTIHLFEKCNLECSFCWQDHAATAGVGTVMDRAYQIVRGLVTEEAQRVVYNVMGGEVFDDSIFGDGLECDYMGFVMLIHNAAKAIGKTVRFSFVSNLVTSQPHRVRRLMETLRLYGADVSLSTSYDVKGRFKPKHLAVFKDNIETLGDLISGVSMLMTLPVMRRIMDGSDGYFKELYDSGKFEIYFDYYTPTTGWIDAPIGDRKTLGERIAPSDFELLQFFDFMTTHYPKVQPFDGWVNNETNPLSCRNTKLILADGTECRCGRLHKESKSIIQFYTGPIHDTDNSAIQTNFVNRWNCQQCEHLARCQMGCFMQHDFTKRGTMAECPFKLTFDKIVYGKEIDYDALTIITPAKTEGVHRHFPITPAG